jgi:hypothetical protein
VPCAMSTALRTEGSIHLRACCQKQKAHMKSACATINMHTPWIRANVTALSFQFPLSTARTTLITRPNQSRSKSLASMNVPCRIPRTCTPFSSNSLSLAIPPKPAVGISHKVAKSTHMPQYTVKYKIARVAGHVSKLSTASRARVHVLEQILC